MGFWIRTGAPRQVPSHVVRRGPGPRQWPATYIEVSFSFSEVPPRGERERDRERERERERERGRERERERDAY